MKLEIIISTEQRAVMIAALNAFATSTANTTPETSDEATELAAMLEAVEVDVSNDFTM